MSPVSWKLSGGRSRACYSQSGPVLGRSLHRGHSSTPHGLVGTSSTDLIQAGEMAGLEIQASIGLIKCASSPPSFDLLGYRLDLIAVGGIFETKPSNRSPNLPKSRDAQFFCNGSNFSDNER
jgi:hypothetical protein